MKKCCLLLFLLTLHLVNAQQEEIVPIVQNIDLNKLESQAIHKQWLQLGDNAFGQPITIPVLIAKGAPGPILGLTAALHGNELNGIPIIQNIFSN